ncbi:methylated-DNA--[protein]-cysteine S-methyltransferase [Cellulomonas xiejunii]|uniref:Methylated-DNA--[protein]-cysteine S-methyltransferase n=1 Tax=Cellulomonas xiejunii TaxID=2968083 RepID=A0ABY5KJU3_9CELL|nr:methylated-DNA--[protein]-cysteine S-methyltransferase [Cellulomonas xiejunii]MCC2319772.1 methylated-DNA--[protein]-cysteine S-methyltransferase [Cellulomonas xiejunii]UUI70110.1 methylated-DNA--[protein]-cysteine S-methyltransferase [Cellulomonas xiejunii]
MSTVQDGRGGDVRDTLAGTHEERLLAVLHARLVARAQDEGLLDVAYRVVDSPVGRVLVAAGDAGVLRVAFEVQGHDAVLDDLAARVSPRVLEGGDRLDPVLRQLDEYFTGSRTSFDVPVDLRLARGLRRDVVEALPRIAYGTTASYTQVAAAVGRPAAVRAVATACALNPVPLLVPCHRVVRSDGSTGRYVGGDEAKRTLLALERTPLVSGAPEA